MQKLTKEQQQIIENNINFIHNIAHKWHNKLYKYESYEDIFQMCAESFTKCVRSYDPTKGKITTYAGKSMNYDMIDYINRKKNKIIKNEVLLCDLINQSDEDDKLKDGNAILTNNEDIENEIINYVNLNDVLNRAKENLKPRHKNIIENYLHHSNQDLTQRELAKVIDVPQSILCKTIKRFRNEVYKELGVC